MDPPLPSTPLTVSNARIVSKSQMMLPSGGRIRPQMAVDRSREHDARHDADRGRLGAGAAAAAGAVQRRRGRVPHPVGRWRVGSRAGRPPPPGDGARPTPARRRAARRLPSPIRCHRARRPCRPALPRSLPPSSGARPQTTPDFWPSVSMRRPPAASAGSASCRSRNPGRPCPGNSRPPACSRSRTTSFGVTCCAHRILPLVMSSATTASLVGAAGAV